MFDIEEELKKLPKKPGVYLMHDENDSIIYVGKAIVLRNRVRSYFRESTNKTMKIRQMVRKISWFEYVVTDSEMEALVLENNLIKEHQPRYNTMLKDDKTYPYIKVTTQETFPRIFLTREVKKDNAKYYGPYTSVNAVKDTIELLRKLYRLRTCSKKLGNTPCLYYHIGQCDAPCLGRISEETYGESVQKALEFLNGNYKPLLSELEEKMQEASERMDFEKAGEYRDLLFSVRQTAQKQKITDAAGEDKDVIAMARDEKSVIIQVFFVRSGKILGREHFYMKNTEDTEDAGTIKSFIMQYYAGTPFIPKELILPFEPEDRELIEQWLTDKRGAKTHITIPQKGKKEKLAELAKKNAQIVLRQDIDKIRREDARTGGAVKEIERLLGLSGIVRMEAYDISNISGFESVGSMIVYEKGKPRRNDYRKFRIRSV
ncbi:MAG TPA: excinuclease ABC subunit UvrC, partial [Lachnospiraceae bacterium]|nr:excinuclease ABC subunit UvrC [Lachnospiraceae bacterium]